MEAKRKLPAVYEYTQYRAFLKDLYAALKDSKPQYSFRYFARIAGFSSHNFLKMVMDGKRNLSPSSIDIFAQAFKLTKEESAFFRDLVMLNQSDTADEKKYYAERLIRSRSFQKLHPLKSSQHAYCSHWYFVAIRELVTCIDFQDDPAWIAKKLVPAITAAEAQKAIDALLELGLLKRDEKGKLIQSEALVSSGDEVSSAFVNQFHKKMMEKASESIELFDIADRDISGITIGLSEGSAKQIKELVQRFRKELLEISNHEPKPDRVYQVNFQIFPLSRWQKDGKR